MTEPLTKHRAVSANSTNGVVPLPLQRKRWKPTPGRRRMTTKVYLCHPHLDPLVNPKPQPHAPSAEAHKRIRFVLAVKPAKVRTPLVFVSWDDHDDENKQNAKFTILSYGLTKLKLRTATNMLLLLLATATATNTPTPPSHYYYHHRRLLLLLYYEASYSYYSCWHCCCHCHCHCHCYDDYHCDKGCVYGCDYDCDCHSSTPAPAALPPPQ